MAAPLSPQLAQRGTQGPSMQRKRLTLSYTNKDNSPTDQLIHIN